jgi:hypothetical protein
MVGYYAGDPSMQLIQPIRDRWRAQSRATRELAILVSALVFGMVGMPLIIHGVGREILGDYETGGASALLMDFFRGLAAGAKAFWAVALGPYVFLLLLRLAFSRRRPPPDQIEV